MQEEFATSMRHSTHLRPNHPLPAFPWSNRRSDSCGPPARAAHLFHRVGRRPMLRPRARRGTAAAPVGGDSGQTEDPTRATPDLDHAPSVPCLDPVRAAVLKRVHRDAGGLHSRHRAFGVDPGETEVGDVLADEHRRAAQRHQLPRRALRVLRARIIRPPSTTPYGRVGLRHLAVRRRAPAECEVSLDP